MALDYSFEPYISCLSIVLSLLGCWLIIRNAWKAWGLLFLSSSVLALLLCYVFVRLQLYSFPYIPFRDYLLFPAPVVGFVFPLLVLLGVKYSPTKWSHKIPFYWIIITLGMAGETLAHNYTRLIKYELFWDFWDSLTAWWLFFLFFEWLGGKFIPAQLRRPWPDEAFGFGRWAWLLTHFFMIFGFIIAGIYLGFQLCKKTYGIS